MLKVILKTAISVIQIIICLLIWWTSKERKETPYVIGFLLLSMMAMWI